MATGSALCMKLDGKARPVWVMVHWPPGDAGSGRLEDACGSRRLGWCIQSLRLLSRGDVEVVQLAQRVEPASMKHD